MLNFIIQLRIWANIQWAQNYENISLEIKYRSRRQLPRMFIETKCSSDGIDLSPINYYSELLAIHQTNWYNFFPISPKTQSLFIYLFNWNLFYFHSVVWMLLFFIIILVSFHFIHSGAAHNGAVHISLHFRAPFDSSPRKKGRKQKKASKKNENENSKKIMNESNRKMDARKMFINKE